MRSSSPVAWPGLVASLVVVLLISGGPAHAQEDPALARAQSLLRQVSGQKQELEVANARLTAELDTLKRQLAGTEATLKSAAQNLEAEKRKVERSGGSLEATRARLETTEDRLRETQEHLRTRSSELRELQRTGVERDSRLAQLESELAGSERRNLQLFEANDELLELYRKKGPLAALLQKEPVTGLKSVAIENELQDYRLRLMDSLSETNRRQLLKGASSGKTAGSEGKR